MSFRRVSIIGTLAAAALALLVILPVWAAEGTDVTGDAEATLRIRVTPYSQVVLDAPNTRTTAPLDADTTDTRLGRVTYVSNQPVRTSNLVVEPANTVFVTVDFPTGFDDDDRQDYVKVRSGSGDSLTLENFGVGGDTALFRVITPGASVPTEDFDNVDTTPPTPMYQALEALDGDSITVTAGENVLRLVVDGVAPAFSNITPDHGLLQDDSDTTIGFIVTDEGSGLRTEAEDGPDPDADIDEDGSTAEPLSKPLTDDDPGASVDIDLVWDGDFDHERKGSRSWEEITKDESYGVSYGLASLSSDKYEWYIEAYDRVGNYRRTDSNGGESGDQDFALTVDNQAPAVSKRFAGIGFDPDENKGKGGEVKDSSSILVIFGNEDLDSPGGAHGDVDPLDSSSIDADDFVVVGNEVVSVIHPNKKPTINRQKILSRTVYTVKAGDDYVGTMLEPNVATALLAVGGDNVAVESINTTNPDETTYDAVQPGTTVELVIGDRIYNWPRPSVAAGDDTCDSNTGYDRSTGRKIAADLANKFNEADCIDTRNRVYLVLATPIGDDDEPEVQLRGGSIRDRAGNGNKSSEEDAANRIAPTLTVTASGDVTTDGRPLAQEDITVNISSGERMLGMPSVWLAEFDKDAKITLPLTPGNVEQESTTSWSVEFSVNDETKVAAVLVSGQDVDQNVQTSAGWKGKAVEKAQLDLAKIEKAGLLVEFDNGIPYAKTDVTLNPPAGSEALETESNFPFIELRFREDEENTKVIPAVDASDEVAAVAEMKFKSDTLKDVKFDSYRRVELSDVTLDGVDVTDSVARLNSTDFDLALSFLEEGEHTLAFTLTDTAGNSRTEEVDFEVLPRGAYEIELRPGWNLVSFPGDPVNTAIDSVLPADHPAIEIIKYEAGIWIAAVRETGQPWEGELTDIDGQSAYWINTTSTKPFAAVLVQPGIGSASRPPAIPLIEGWNLIPVTDLDQADEGELQPNYFSSLSMDDFVVAYTYDSRIRSWDRIPQTPLADRVDKKKGVAKNGQGVWVYSRSNVTLVP